jgi:hypothetical protein
MKLQLSLAALCALALSGPAWAAPHDGAAFIHDYDGDHDGKVTHAEFDAGRVARFRATDANQDGSLSQEEYVGEYQARLEQQLATSHLDEEKKTEERQRQMRQAHVRFGVLDRDHDTKMTQAEYAASGMRAFTEQDDDKDGTITTADVAATQARRLAARRTAD